MKKLLLPFLLILFGYNGFSQLEDDGSGIDSVAAKKIEVEPIATDRPDQTECPNIVPKGMIQIETGYCVQNDKDKLTRSKDRTYNTTLWKLGVSKNFEFRLITEYLGLTLYDRSTNKVLATQRGMNSIAIGSKINICEEGKWMPMISLITHLQLPYFGAQIYRPGHIAPRFRFVLQKTLSERFTLTSNLGGEWDGDSDAATGIYTLALSVALVKNLGFYIESYGFVTENSNNDGNFNGTFANDHRLDGGFTYLLTNDLQLDVSAGIGLSRNSPNNFVGCGISYRFGKH